MSEPYSAADGLVRVYTGRAPSRADAARPGEATTGAAGAGLVWAHGGGFAFGDLDMPEADAVARALAATGVTVVSVDYRLVHEGCRYPAPSDDVVAAWSFTLDNAERLGLDPARLAIGGASAGANLATGAVLRLIAGGAALPAAVVLAYPTLHAIQPAPGPALRAALDADPEADRFGPAAVLDMYENYLGGPVDDAPVAAIPGLAAASSLTDFPRTLMINGDTDELRVSGEAFGAALRSAGVTADVVTEPGTRHGHLNQPDQPAFSSSIDRIATFLAGLPASPNAPASINAPASADAPTPTDAPTSPADHLTEGSPT